MSNLLTYPDPTTKTDETQTDTLPPPPAEDTQQQIRFDLKNGDVVILDDDGYCD